MSSKDDSKIRRQRYCVESYEEPPVDGRVLSVQSHVVHGYVGNKSAVFPLQVLGLDVDPICSVQFSNHTGYPTIKGEVLNGDQLWDLIEGLQANGLARYNYLLTGYTGSPTFLRTILKTLKTLRSLNPSLKYFCDPVMGDGGKLYVPEELVDIYKFEVLPEADVILPNQFELEKLTDIEIRTFDDVIEACRNIHKRGPEMIVLTSLDLEERPTEEISLFVSKCRPSPHQGYDRFRLDLPRIEGSYTGTGDLIAALILAWSHRYPYDLAYVLERAAATMQALLCRTLREVGPGAEIRLIQSQNDIENPQIIARAIPLNPTVLGVVFDMDGTLTEPGLLDFGKIRAQFGLVNSGNILADIREAPINTQDAARNAVIEAEKECAEKIKMRPGLEPMLASLRERNIRIGLATQNSLASVRTLFGRYKIDLQIFDPVITRESEVTKYDADVLRTVCRQWDIQPSNLLMVGDSKIDMQVGRRVGARTCRMRCPKKDTFSHLVDFCIDQLSEVTDLVQMITRESM